MNLSEEEQKAKLLEYGSIEHQQEGKIIDDELDEQAEVEMKTVFRIIKYYGHWSILLFFLFLEISLSYLSNKAEY